MIKYNEYDIDPQSQTDTIGYGAEKRKQGNKDVLDGKKHFR